MKSSLGLLSKNYKGIGMRHCPDRRGTIFNTYVNRLAHERGDNSEVNLGTPCDDYQKEAGLGKSNKRISG